MDILVSEIAALWSVAMKSFMVQIHPQIQRLQRVGNPFHRDFCSSDLLPEQLLFFIENDIALAMVLLTAVITIPPLLGVKIVYNTVWFIFVTVSVMVDSPTAIGLAASMGITLGICWYTLQLLDRGVWPALLRGWLGVWGSSTRVASAARLVDVTVHAILPAALAITSIHRISPWMGLPILIASQTWQALNCGWRKPADHLFRFQPPRSQQFWNAAFRIEVVLEVTIPLMVHVASWRSMRVLALTLVVGIFVLVVLILRSVLHPLLQTKATKIITRLISSGHIEIGREIVVHDDAFWLEWLTSGMLAIGESYVAQQWDEGDIKLSDIIGRLMVLPGHARREVFRSWTARVVALTSRVFSYPTSSERHLISTIPSQYDIRADFYRQWLDDKLLFTCGRWHEAQGDLEVAQEKQILRIAEVLQLQENQHVLVWTPAPCGGLAKILAQRYRVKVTLLVSTPSDRKDAMEVLALQDVSDRVIVVEGDLLHLNSLFQSHAFENVVILHGLESVGMQHYETFLRRLSVVCKRNAKILIHMACSSRQIHLEEQKWIVKYVNPNQMQFIPSLNHVRRTVQKHFSLVADRKNLQSSIDMSTDARLTFDSWTRRFSRKILDHSINLPESFERTWYFYLSYCAASYAMDALKLNELLLQKSY